MSAPTTTGQRPGSPRPSESDRRGFRRVDSEKSVSEYFREACEEGRSLREDIEKHGVEVSYGHHLDERRIYINKRASDGTNRGWSGTVSDTWPPARHLAKFMDDFDKYEQGDTPAVGDVVMTRGQGETDAELSRRAAILAAHHGVPIWCDNKRIDQPDELGRVPTDLIRAWVGGGELIVERAEMERVKALGVDIREVPESSYGSTNTRIRQWPTPDYSGTSEIWGRSPPAKPKCPDCKGSKRYEGLREAGPCLTCGGAA